MWKSGVENYLSFGLEDNQRTNRSSNSKTPAQTS